MRTLVINFPLPNLNFDNFSFLSAPSFIEYQRVIVDIGATATAVQQAADGEGAHTTYGGQAIVNGVTSAHAFPLAELLEMRRREAELLLSHGGLIILITHPETTVPGVDGADWRSYSWLPEPENFSFTRDILPGFGRQGAVLTDPDHPFGPYIRDLAPRIAYRAYLNESAQGFAETGAIFARSAGGVAIGFDVATAGGRLLLLPTLADPTKDRPVIANAIVGSLDLLDTSAANKSRTRSAAERL